MPILGQAGWGRGNKVHDGLSAGSLSGAIFSPKDERRARIEASIKELRAEHPEAILLFDPQFYAAAMTEPRDGRLPEYDYYADNAGLNRTQFSPRQIQKYVRACLEYQLKDLTGLSYLVSPAVFFEDFNDSWSQVCLSMADASVDYHASLKVSPPLLISVVTSEVALRNSTGLSEFLDALSSIDVQGFYILVNRNAGSYQAAMEPPVMANLMYCVYVLGALNDYEVFVGYSDWLGFLLEAAGARATATGWHQSLRQFSTARFQPAGGGRRPRKRYSSLPLLSSVLINPELEDVYLEGMLRHVVTGGKQDEVLRGGPVAGEADWTDDIACLAHWDALRLASDEIAAARRPSRKLAVAEGLISSAETLYTRLERRGIRFEPQTGPGHLALWRNAVNDFRTVAGIQ